MNAPALDAFAADEPALAGPFDLAFIDALKPEYERYLAALTSRLAPGALVVADNVLWSGRVSGARPVAADDANTAALRAFDTAVLGRSSLQRDDPAGRRRPAHRLVARLTAAASVAIRVRVRLFAIQRELAGTREVPLELPDGADVEAAWTALVARFPVLAPGRAVGPLRAQRRVRRRRRRRSPTATRWR